MYSDTGRQSVKFAYKRNYGDDEGENVSNKNRQYCELTIQYYAWKNEECSHYGFCHYRRFFCFDERVKQPYLAFGKISESRKRKYFGTAERIEKTCSEFDIILPRAEDTKVSARDYYNTSAHHFSGDLEILLNIISEKYPELNSFANKYMSQSRQYFCNMFIMSKDYFNEYCTYLFDILEEFDKRKTLHGSFQDDRTDGYLGERFVGIYLYYAKSRGARIKEISRIDVGCTIFKRIGCVLFPPESNARMLARKLINRRKR